MDMFNTLTYKKKYALRSARANVNFAEMLVENVGISVGSSVQMAGPGTKVHVDELNLNGDKNGFFSVKLSASHLIVIEYR